MSININQISERNKIDQERQYFAVIDGLIIYRPVTIIIIYTVLVNFQFDT